MKQAAGKPDKLFAEYRFTPSARRGNKFEF